MSRSRKATKHPRFRDIDAWDALKRCDLECAINLLISGEWIIDSIVKDGWSPLNARVDSERCHVTALLAFILRCLMIDYLRDSNLCEEFKTLIAEYCSSRTEDKQWTHVFKREDVYIENSAGYNSVLGSVIDFMGPDWTTFVASVRTITSFSILSTMECGLNIYYRRLGDVLVATSKEQQAAGMGKFHDAEFPLRTAFTEVSFNLTEKLSEQILPCGIWLKTFDTKPRVCQTLVEQIREVFHFSKTKKVNPRQKKKKTFHCHRLFLRFYANFDQTLSGVQHTNHVVHAPPPIS